MSSERISPQRSKEHRGWKIYAASIAVAAAPLFFGIKYITEGIQDATSDFYETHPAIEEAVDVRSDFHRSVSESLRSQDWEGLKVIVESIPDIIEAQDLIDKYQEEIPDEPLINITAGVAISCFGLMLGLLPIALSDTNKKKLIKEKKE